MQCPADPPKRRTLTRSESRALSRGGSVLGRRREREVIDVRCITLHRRKLYRLHAHTTSFRLGNGPLTWTRSYRPPLSLHDDRAPSNRSSHGAGRRAEAGAEAADAVGADAVRAVEALTSAQVHDAGAGEQLQAGVEDTHRRERGRGRGKGEGKERRGRRSGDGGGEKETSVEREREE
jgi:hypothetical protein